jgi:alpha/beta superfamily hydrolase
MIEEKIYIENDSLIIEGLLCKGSSEQGVLICHPHPLMGGSMYNNAVEAIAEAYAAENFTTLRFNFRGVGQSTGAYDEGRGEVQDILAAHRYLVNSGLSKIYFIGYSFGAWVGSKVLNQNNKIFAGAIFVSPPNKYFDFTKLTDNLDLIVCGNRDDFCDLSVVKKQIENTKTELETISGADHFYLGKEKELMDILRKHIIK